MTAPDHLEPYTTRLTIEGRLPNPLGFATTLLTNLAQRCHKEGASLIGHIKCHCRTPAGAFHCSLTSLRTGAKCSRGALLDELPVGRIEIDLAVLVYGLERDTLDSLTRATANALCGSEDASCSFEPPSTDHIHAGRPPRTTASSSSTAHEGEHGEDCR